MVTIIPNLAPIPEDLVILLNKGKAANRSTPPTGGPVVHEGGRNDYLIRLAGQLRRLGMDYDEILPRLQAANQNFPRPLEPKEVEGVAQGIMRYRSGLDLTEDGIARALAEEAAGKVKFTPAHRGFMAYRSGVWVRDREGLALQELFKEWLKRKKDEVAQDQGLEDKERKALLKRIDGLRKKSSIRGAIQLTKSHPAIFDDEPWYEPELVVNFRNGTLKLPSLELHPHRPEDRLMKMLDYDYDPRAACPIFEHVVAQALGDEKAAFLKRLFGYAVAGTGGLQKMALLKGVGRNGKSAIAGAVDHAMGRYSVTTEPTTFLNGNKAAINNAVAALNGARLVPTSELSTGQGLDAALVKRMTGGDRLSARFLYSEFFEFEFKGLILMVTNFAPLFDGSDSATARRLLVIDFPKVIDPKDDDGTLSEKMKAEAPGIMNWLLQGYLEFCEGGIQIPVSVQAETDATVRDHNQVLQFVEDRCTQGADLKVQASPFYRAYQAWCISESLKSMSMPAFKAAVGRTFSFTQSRTKDGLFWYGVGLRPGVAGIW
jgi:putative DNA primase/helicase